MGIHQIVPPNQQKLTQPNKKIVLLGGGPASLSCATFLGRFGYKDITIFEKQSYLGGLRYYARLYILNKLSRITINS